MWSPRALDLIDPNILHPMLALTAASALGYVLNGQPAVKAQTKAVTAQMLYGEPRPVQIIPSVLPADWAIEQPAVLLSCSSLNGQF